jgi:hypothetical protein
VKAIRIHRHGGPEVFVYEDGDIGQPGPGQVHVRNHRAAEREHRVVHVAAPLGADCEALSGSARRRSARRRSGASQRDVIGTAEQRVTDLTAQMEASRDPSTSLAFD